MVLVTVATRPAGRPAGNLPVASRPAGKPAGGLASFTVALIACKSRFPIAGSPAQVIPHASQ